MQINPDFNSSAFTIRSYRANEIDVFKPIKIEELQCMEDKIIEEKIKDIGEFLAYI